jgi:hypothetical protein
MCCIVKQWCQANVRVYDMGWDNYCRMVSFYCISFKVWHVAGTFDSSGYGVSPPEGQWPINCGYLVACIFPGLFYLCFHVLCHHGMARPQVRGDDLYIWRVTANLLSSRGQPTRGSQAWELSVGLTTHRKKKSILLHDRAWKYYLDKRPELRKMDLRFRTRNIRSLYCVDSLVTVAWS